MKCENKMSLRRLFTLAVVACGLKLMAFVPAVAISDGPIVPGEWNSSFEQGKAFAEANNIPMFLVWVSPSCGHCQDTTRKMAADSFVVWQQQRQYVMVYCYGGNSDAKDFARNSSGKFPYLAVYYPKADGTQILERFSGLEGYTPQKGSGIAEAIMNSVDYLVTGTSSSPVVSTTGTVPSEWKNSRNLTGAVYDLNRNVIGVLTIKAGRASSAGVAKVQAKYVPINGRRRTFKSQKVTVSSNTSFSLSAAGYGELTIDSMSGDAFSGSISGSDGTFVVTAATIGGSLPAGTYSFSLVSSPIEVHAKSVLTEFLPNGMDVQLNGARFTIAKGGVVKFDGTAFRSSTENPSGLKLSYTPRTGVLKGSFGVYVQQTATSAKKNNAVLKGYCVNGTGYCYVSIRNVGELYNATLTLK